MNSCADCGHGPGINPSWADRPEDCFCACHDHDRTVAQAGRLFQELARKQARFHVEQLDGPECARCGRRFPQAEIELDAHDEIVCPLCYLKHPHPQDIAGVLAEIEMQLNCSPDLDFSA